MNKQNQMRIALAVLVAIRLKHTQKRISVVAVEVIAVKS